MNLFKLSYSYLKRRALNSFLNILLLSFGIATVVILLIFSYQLEENLFKNAQGVDVVVGAKGSPIQLILSSIYQIDSPTGNIDLADAKELMNNRMVASAVPLALGDNFRGYRLVGTTPDYLELYGAGLTEGTLWDHEYEIVAGAKAAENESLEPGDTIISSHGMLGEGSDHENHEMHVVGVLEPTGGIIDRLILSGVETMWRIHAYEETGEMDGNQEQSQIADENQAGHDHSHGSQITDSSYLDDRNNDEQITSMLISYSSPLAAAQFPRYVNAETSMQAAAPAVEITRLLNLLGVGLDAIQIFAYVLIFASVLGIFIALLNSMKERKYDLAIMRTLGGYRWKLFMHIIIEGILIAVAGALLGMLLGHAAIEGLGVLFAEAQQFDVTGFVLIPGEAWILVLAIGIGVLSSLLPAIQAYRTDIAETLSKT